MKIKDLWESDFEFRKVAINYLKKFEKEMQDIEQRHDAWGSFLYKGLHYDLNLYIHENEDYFRQVLSIRCERIQRFVMAISF